MNNRTRLRAIEASRGKGRMPAYAEALGDYAPGSEAEAADIARQLAESRQRGACDRLPPLVIRRHPEVKP